MGAMKGRTRTKKMNHRTHVTGQKNARAPSHALRGTYELKLVIAFAGKHSSKFISGDQKGRVVEGEMGCLLGVPKREEVRRGVGKIGKNCTMIVQVKPARRILSSPVYSQQLVQRPR